MSSGQDPRTDGEVQPDPDTGYRDLVDAVRSVAAELKQIRLNLQGKGGKLKGVFMSAPKAKFGSAIKPKSYK